MKEPLKTYTTSVDLSPTKTPFSKDRESVLFDGTSTPISYLICSPVVIRKRTIREPFQLTLEQISYPGSTMITMKPIFFKSVFDVMVQYDSRKKVGAGGIFLVC